MSEEKIEQYARDEAGQPVIEECPADGCPAPKPWIMECAEGRTWILVCDEGHMAIIMNGRGAEE